MTDALMQGLKKSIQGLKWMDDETKDLAVKKVQQNQNSSVIHFS